MPDKKEYIGSNRLSQILTYIKEKFDGVDTNLSTKVDKVNGKALSTNDFTDAFKTKLEGVATGAQVNVQSDWDVNDSSSDAFIIHKPTKLSQFTNDIVTDNNPSLSWATKSKVATIGGIEINVTMPANPNTDTTYSLSRDGTSVKLTPSSGTAQSVSLDSLLTNLATWTATPTDDTYLIRRDTAGGAAYGQVKFSTVWSYIDSKVAAAGYTKNAGTVTSVKVGDTSYSPSSGVVSLPAYPDISTKVSKAGDTMTGALTFSASNTSAIQYAGTKATYAMIKFMDNTNDAYGNGIAIGGGGATLIGGGESVDVVKANITGGSEEMIISNDSGNISFIPNTDSGWANRKTSYFDVNGDLHVNRYVYATYYNQSSAEESGSASTSSYIIYANSDGWHRKMTNAKLNSIIYPYEANLQWGGRNFTGSYGCVDAAMADPLRANRLAFIPAAAVTVEYTRNGGTTWTDYGASNASKTALFTTSTGFVIGKADSTNKATANADKYQLRVTIDSITGNFYTEFKKFIILVSTSGSNSCTVTIEGAKGNAETSFSTLVSATSISGWSGYNVINTSFTSYGNSSAASSQYKKIRFLFKANGGNTSYNGLNVLSIYGYGGVGWNAPSTMAKSAHLYSYDQDQNATFPAIVQGNTMIIQKGTAGTNTYADANPKLIFKNSDGSQCLSLTYTDYDSVQSPSSLTLNGNQGGEYFIAANIKATTKFYGNLQGNADTATKATQDGSGNTITSTYFKLSGGTITGATIVNAATTVNAAITFGKSDSYGIFPSTHNYCSIGSENYCFFQAYVNNLYLGKSSNYTGSIYFKHKNSSKKTQIAPQAETSDSTLWLPIGGGTFATQEWVKTKNVYCTETGPDGASFICYIENGLYHILVAQGLNTVVSTAYGSWFYSPKTISIPTTVQTFIGSKTKFAFAGSAVNSGSGLHTISIQAVSKTSISYYLCSARSESAKQYYVYFHYYYIP